jgi:hypothetical protein
MAGAFGTHEIPPLKAIVGQARPLIPSSHPPNGILLPVTKRVISGFYTLLCGVGVDKV